MKLSKPTVHLAAYADYDVTGVAEVDVQDLDGALTGGDPVKVRRLFRRYRKQSGDRFVWVDKALKRLCDKLRTIGEPLASVLRMIE